MNMNRNAQRSLCVWLNILVKERISEDILVTHAETGWKITVDSCEQRLEIAIDEKLYSGSPLDSFFEYHISAGEFENNLIPSLILVGRSEFSGSLVTRDSKSVTRIGYDVFGLFFWFLSRIEETNGEKDSFGRFSAKSSRAYLWGLLERAIVDEWVEILRSVVRENYPQITLSDQRYSEFVSHDVDHVSRYGYASTARLAKRVIVDTLTRKGLGSISAAIRTRSSIGKSLHVDDPYNSYDFLMDVSESFGLRSAFYFMTRKSSSIYDCDYELSFSAVKKVLENIHKRGHEVGLHPSFSCYADPSALKFEATKLIDECTKIGIEQESWGGRFHYLRIDMPHSLYGWTDAGFQYDNSLGYADHIGFRSGTCHEYPAIDSITFELVGIRIRPLVVMDASLLSPQYMNLSEEEARIRVRSIKDVCRRVNGCFSLLWHNDSVSTTAQRNFYCQIMGM